MADREMAAAERAVAAGGADVHLIDRVAALTGVRTHEDRRHHWMHP